MNHLLFWREVTLRVVRGAPESDQAELERRNWETPSQTNAEAWQPTVHRFEASHREMEETLAATGGELERFRYHLFHDSYHIGQIMQLRAMQGLPPVV